MSRVLTIFVILSALATGTAIALGLAAESLAWNLFWPDFTRALAVVSLIVTALVWCTERVCAEVSTSQTAMRQEIQDLRAAMQQEVQTLRVAAGRREKRIIKRIRRLEILTQERIEASHQVQNLFDPSRKRAN